MIIAEWRNRTLESEEKLDKDEKLYIEITEDDNCIYMYLNKKQIKSLIEQLQNVL